MSLTVREVVEHMYRYLRKEQREIPLTNPDIDDPLPEALAAINGALQAMAVKAPQFAVTPPRSAHFRPPTTVAVTGLSNGAKAATAAEWPTGAAGCLLTLPGDAEPNRIVYILDGVATLQFPYLGNSASGNATLKYDSVDLEPDTITVYDPVTPRGGMPLRPANGRWNQQLPVEVTSDFGRRRVTRSNCPDGDSYRITSVQVPGAGFPQLRMTLRSPATSDLVLEFQARCSLANFTVQDAHNGALIPVPSDFTESIFLPLAMMRFFGSSVMRNTDVPQYIAKQEEEAMSMLALMRPQGRKPVKLYPGL